MSRLPSPSLAREADPALHGSLQSAEHAGCLVCGAGNPTGLQLRFRTADDGRVVVRAAGKFMDRSRQRATAG